MCQMVRMHNKHMRIYEKQWQLAAMNDFVHIYKCLKGQANYNGFGAIKQNTHEMLKVVIIRIKYPKYIYIKKNNNVVITKKNIHIYFFKNLLPNNQFVCEKEIGLSKN